MNEINGSPRCINYSQSPARLTWVLAESQPPSCWFPFWMQAYLSPPDLTGHPGWRKTPTWCCGSPDKRTNKTMLQLNWAPVLPCGLSILPGFSSAGSCWLWAHRYILIGVALTGCGWVLKNDFYCWRNFKSWSKKAKSCPTGLLHQCKICLPLSPTVFLNEQEKDHHLPV